MTEWAMVHPWMTFWLIVIGMQVFGTVSVSIAEMLKPKVWTPKE